MNDFTTKIRPQVKKSFLSRNFQIKSTNSMIAIKTTLGNVNSWAMIIDRFGIPEILGAIAEDDTILPIFDTDESRKRIRQYIRRESIAFCKKEGN